MHGEASSLYSLHVFLFAWLFGWVFLCVDDAFVFHETEEVLREEALAAQRKALGEEGEDDETASLWSDAR